jgi:hypothetical protein
MTIQEPANTAIKAAFFDELFTELKKYPFGSMPKRDMDCLLFHLLRRHALINGTNHTIAAGLGINETRVKSYHMDSHYKYEQDTKDRNVMQIVTDLCNGTIKFVFENSWYSFVIENPVVKTDFETKLKEMGFFADTSFNKEVVKIKDNVMLAFLLEQSAVRGLDDSLYNAIASKAADQEAAVLNYKNKHASPREKAKEILKLVIKNIPYGDILQLVAPVFIPSKK